MMMEPEELTRDFYRMIELEREGERGDPRREAWAEMPTRWPASLEEGPSVCRTRATTPRSAHAAGRRSGVWGSRGCSASPGGVWLLLVYEGLTQVENRRGPQADEDPRLPPAAHVQEERDQYREQSAYHVNLLCRTQNEPPL